jgi:hypothetical protein
VHVSAICCMCVCVCVAYKSEEDCSTRFTGFTSSSWRMEGWAVGGVEEVGRCARAQEPVCGVPRGRAITRLGRLLDEVYPFLHLQLVFFDPFASYHRLLNAVVDQLEQHIGLRVPNHRKQQGGGGRGVENRRGK